MPRASARAALAAALEIGLALPLLLLAGCGRLVGEPQPEPPRCPNVSILEGAGISTGHGPGVGEDGQSLRYIVGLSEARSTCRYSADGLEVDLAFNVLAEKGPAFGQGPLQVTYFVATVGPDRQVRSKRLFSSELAFPAGRPVAGQAESLTLRYPFVFAAEGATLHLYVGFQLEPAEIRRRQQRLLP